jgi:hypothetical protein
MTKMVQSDPWFPTGQLADVEECDGEEERGGGNMAVSSVRLRVAGVWSPRGWTEETRVKHRGGGHHVIGNRRGKSREATHGEPGQSASGIFYDL